MQALFNSLGDEVNGKTIGLGGDGRYYNKEAAQTIIKLAAAAGVKKVQMPMTLLASPFLILRCISTKYHSKCFSLHQIEAPCVDGQTCLSVDPGSVDSLCLQVLVGKDAIMATPAMSALIRRRELYGASFFGTCLTALATCPLI